MSQRVGFDSPSSRNEGMASRKRLLEDEFDDADPWTQGDEGGKPTSLLKVLLSEELALIHISLLQTCVGLALLAASR